MKRITTLVLLLGIVFYANAQVKVVGYFPDYQFQKNTLIDYRKLTHLNICFANPDSAGNLQINSIKDVTARARQQNPDIKILISLGGGALTAQQRKNWATLIGNSTNRAMFTKKINSFILTHGLDGADIDLEGAAITTGYSSFVIQLKNLLAKKGKLVTAALSPIQRHALITTTALNKFDFINVMAYDETGPWTPETPGQHSSYNYALRAIDFWKNTQKVPANKIVLGVPFHGYNFTDLKKIKQFAYADMVTMNKNYADRDFVAKYYYNGRVTMKAKTELAYKEVGGIMIWELGQDKLNEYSLLTVIHNKLLSLKATQDSIDSAKSLKVETVTSFTNSNNNTYQQIAPLNDFDKITLPANGEQSKSNKEDLIENNILLNVKSNRAKFSVPAGSFTSVKLYNLQGKCEAEMFNQNTISGHTYSVNIDDFINRKGFYIISLNSNGSVVNRRVFIQ